MKKKSVYVCSECGSVSPRWQGQCPHCGMWNCLAEQTAPRKAGTARQAAAGAIHAPVALADFSEERAVPYSSGLDALDQVLGKGLMPGGVVLLAGDPGIGKSTLLLQLAASISRSGRRALYLSAEESLGQVHARAKRLVASPPDLLALSTTRLEDALAAIGGPDRPDLMIVDSVQTLSSDDVEGLPGSVSQVRAVSTSLIEAAKSNGATLILVGHVTKDGQIAGPKLLEHMVDTVLSLEGDRRHLYRILRVMKNRFGPSHEMVVFEMRGSGMEVVHDPSTFFLQDRNPGLSGTALVMAIDGQRPFAVEVQALVSKSFLAIPRRTALGFDANRLHLLLAVLEKRLRLNLSQVDIYTKIGGGLKMTDPGLDAGIVAAVLSSFYDRALPEGAVVWGEVDLNGQIRPVTSHDIRLKQAQRLGYGPIVGPASGGRGARTIVDLQTSLFGKG
ncbi:DNA repair protein RadA/Sms [Desulfobaculum xiamenense]|uniref:DNA repair protein RadA n=1 Tax=Desulfobaculum xiamenense TaxID=995050 RepID=A0A846QNZ7_9BACT|nr:DNA repair protein RadA [Desulfobaculum xiamenense]NJB66934.1 DNA repair protein RadA/Sms [Desulfobaculum xiamenense]